MEVVQRDGELRKKERRRREGKREEGKREREGEGGRARGKMGR